MRKTFFTAALLACGMMAQAKVTLPSVYTDNMVLQQKSTLKIHGRARPNADVTLQTGWSRAAINTKSDARGHWYMEVATPKASCEPYTLLFSDGEDTMLKNVLVGEIWLGSGQSNMEMPLAGWGKVFNYEEEIANANFPNIRLFQVKNVLDLKERDCFNLEYNMDGWQECSPKTVPEFSAVCYFFASQLWNELKIPIGVIDSNWGGTPAQAWISAEALGRVMGFQEQMAWMEQKGSKLADEMTRIQQEWNDTYNTRDIGLTTARPWFKTEIDDKNWPTMTLPGAWEGKGLPGLDGVVWFRKTIEIPQAMAGKDIQLNLGQVDDADITYFNGEQVGQTNGYANNRLYTIPGNLVKAGRNVIAVRVSDMGNGGGFLSKADQLHYTVGGQKTSLAGGWQYAVGLNVAHFGERPKTVNSHYPSVLYNAMINPMIDFPIKGVLWYQGCSNVGAAVQHESLFQTLIQEWRDKWQQPDMPFYFAQLANYLTPRDVQPDSEWALLRETQEKALTLHNTGMACNIDIGDAKDIHPKSKRELGRRMAAIALHKTYGKKDVVYTAPIYKKYQVIGDEVHIEFDYPEGSEPFIQDNNLPGFTIAGPDHKWYVASAKTDGKKVIVRSNKVKYPVAVRYGWADNPTCTLHTEGNFPVTPFRTDNWQVSNK